MEFQWTHAINIEQLGLAGVIIIYLVDQIRRKDLLLHQWQHKALDIAQNSKDELLEATKVFEKVLAFIKD